MERIGAQHVVELYNLADNRMAGSVESAALTLRAACGALQVFDGGLAPKDG